jgi:hypothetical protein
VRPKSNFWRVAAVGTAALAVMPVLAAEASPSRAMKVEPLARSAAAALPAKNGRYVGRTSQALPIELRTTRSGRSMTGSLLDVVGCPGAGVTLRWPHSFTAKLPARGSFRGGYQSQEDVPDSAEVGAGDLRGTYSHSLVATFSTPSRRGAKVVSGSWHSHLTIRDGNGAVAQECDSGTVSFKARLR